MILLGEKEKPFDNFSNHFVQFFYVIEAVLFMFFRLFWHITCGFSEENDVFHQNIDAFTAYFVKFSSNQSHLARVIYPDEKL